MIRRGLLDFDCVLWHAESCIMQPTHAPRWAVLQGRPFVLVRRCFFFLAACKRLGKSTQTNKPCRFPPVNFRTLKLLHQYPNLLVRQQVDKGAVKFILSGANIMCPGLTSPGANMVDAAVDTPIVRCLPFDFFLFFPWGREAEGGTVGRGQRALRHRNPTPSCLVLKQTADPTPSCPPRRVHGRRLSMRKGRNTRSELGS